MVENRGPLVVRTNYWATPLARAGVPFASFDAGALRVLVPERMTVAGGEGPASGTEATAALLGAARDAVDVWVMRPLAVPTDLDSMVLAVFLDAGHRPWGTPFLAFDREVVDWIPLVTDIGRSLQVSFWTRGAGGRSTCRVVRAPALTLLPT